MRTILFSTGLVCFAAAPSARGEHVFVLRMAGSGVTIEKMALTEGKELTLSCDPKSGIIDVIFPVGPGGSGSLARFADERTITAKQSGNEISVSDRAKSGKQWQRPARSLDDLRGCDVRVSVISHEGQRKAFLIRGYKEVAADPVDLVVDLFAGKIPTRSGDYLIHTETYETKIDDPLCGAAPLEYSRYLYARGRLANGSEGTFVIDLGAGHTIVAKGFLPTDSIISDVGVAQYSSAGREILEYAPQGATGTTQILGSVKLPLLALGGLTYTNVSVAVIRGLPELGGRHIDGIIGLDLLRRNRFLTLEYGTPAPGHGILRLDSVAGDMNKTASSALFSMINSHLVIETKVNAQPVAAILDTGTPVCFLDTQAAAACGVKLDETNAMEVHGLDAGSAPVRNGRVDDFRVADHVFLNIEAVIGSLSVFAPLRVYNQSVGLLGNSILSRMNRMEIDFSTNQIQFFQSNDSLSSEETPVP